MYNVELTESYFPAQGGEAPAPMTIGEMLRQSVSQAGDTLALKELGYDGAIGRTWTYAELLAESERLARALASRHEEGSRIAVYANNVPEWVLLELACGLAGVILVTVNPAYQKRELKYVLEQSRSEAIYYVADFRGNPMQEIADSVCDEIPAIKHRILLTDHDALFAGEDQGALRDPKPDDPVQIQYTSGTTGFPKGALLHHNGLVRNGVDAMTRAGVRAGDPGGTGAGGPRARAGRGGGGRGGRGARRGRGGRSGRGGARGACTSVVGASSLGGGGR